MTTDWNALLDGLTDETRSVESRVADLASVSGGDVTPRMLATCAEWVLARALPLEIDADAVDVCGTGGDSGKGGIKTFNISTAAAFVVAAGGAPVVKHGNRAVTSQSGSSDVLATLGVPVCDTARMAQDCFARHGLAFISAPAFHPVLKSVAPVRKAHGKATFFNLLGPLCNPARTKRQLIGVFAPQFVEVVAETAKLLGKTRVIAVCGEDGLDEISVCAPTRIADTCGLNVPRGTFNPQNHAPAESLRGGTAAENAQIIASIFKGETTGPAHDVVCLNAGAGFVVAGLDATIEDGAARAKEVIARSDALKKLEEMQA